MEEKTSINIKYNNDGKYIILGNGITTKIDDFKENITAKSCNGVLRIELPKLITMPEKKPTRMIDIK